MTSWYGIVARSGTPPAIVRKVSEDMAEALRQPDIVKKLEEQGLEPVGDTPRAIRRLDPVREPQVGRHREEGQHQGRSETDRHHLSERPRRRAPRAHRRRDPRRRRGGAARAGSRRDGDRAARAPRARPARSAGTSTCCAATSRRSASPASRSSATTSTTTRAGLPSELALLNLFDPTTGHAAGGDRRGRPSPTCAPAP